MIFYIFHSSGLWDITKNVGITHSILPALFLPLSGSSIIRSIKTNAILKSDVILLHQQQTIHKMKATTIIIAAVLSLQVSVLFADNNETRPTINNEAVSFNISTLAPVTPAEADFNDSAEDQAVDFSALAPVTPAEADFE